MFQLSDRQMVLSATDLTNHLACPHLTQQKLGIARKIRGHARPAESAHAELLRKRGDEHERKHLGLLTKAAGGDVVDLTRKRFHDENGHRLLETSDSLLEAAAATAAAMQTGHRLIYQGHFFDGTWQGSTDFLRRVDGAISALGDYAYEVLDTKLSKQVKPHVVHQLAVYSRLASAVQGAELPVAQVILGNDVIEPVDLAKYGALHRRVVRRFEAVVAGDPAPTYPEPVAHCPICSLAAECSARLIADDHLSLVANARRSQREALLDLGLGTVASLASAAADVDSGALGPDRFEILRSQASLQVESRTTKQPKRKHLRPVRAAGYAMLPDPNPGDIFFDLEGDPYVTADGIEYLWGWSTPRVPAAVGSVGDPLVPAARSSVDGRQAPAAEGSVDESGDSRMRSGGYECIWAHDDAEEKRALEAFVDHVVAQRKLHPGLHVFHYAPHERSKLLSLSVKYATRESEVDQFARSGVLVDLYAVVARALQVGEDSYSLKKLERHHGFQRLETTVREGGGSIVAYEGYVETGDEVLLESIRAYNEEDCRSTESLRDWLQQELLPEAAEEFGVDFAALRKPVAVEEFGDPEWVVEATELAARLHAGLPEVAGVDTPQERERRLAGHMVLYHRREQKPEFWRYFDLLQTSPDKLVDEREALGLIRRDELVAPISPGGKSRSLDYAFTCPPQEFKQPLQVMDPATEKGVNLVSVNAEQGRLTIRRGKAAEGDPFPQALVPGQPLAVKVMREALVEFAEAVLVGDGRFGAVRRLLRREPPRLVGGVALGESTAALQAAALALDESVLPVQGPPGTGKTYNGARMIVAAVQAGRRVGVSAQSHAAIQNLLNAVEDYAAEVGAAVNGVYKGSAGRPWESPRGFVTVVDDNDGVTDDFTLVAGTSWLFSRPQFRGDGEPAFDLIFIDEAGQFALASAVAVGMAAKSLVLLGDPQQLPQVTKAEHPDGSGASVLGHVLGEHATIPADRGVLLTESWRMHPEICDFVSEQSYDGRLQAEALCTERWIEAPGGSLRGAGLRAIEVDHRGCSQTSVSEADAIAAACRALLAGGQVTGPNRATGVVETRPLRPADLMVVAPYNLAVQCIQERVPEGVIVGTVDKIQGQEAPVVFYALTCSTAEDVPRGLDFLFDPNRLNVAVSRAQCLSILVHSPALLDANCRTLEAMARANGACWFAEVAGRADAAAPVS